MFAKTFTVAMLAALAVAAPLKMRADTDPAGQASPDNKDLYPPSVPFAGSAGTLSGLTGALTGGIGAGTGSLTGAKTGAATGAVNGAATGAVSGAAKGADNGAATGAATGAVNGAATGAVNGAVKGAVSGDADAAVDAAAAAATHEKDGEDEKNAKGGLLSDVLNLVEGLLGGKKSDFAAGGNAAEGGDSATQSGDKAAQEVNSTVGRGGDLLGGLSNKE